MTFNISKNIQDKNILQSIKRSPNIFKFLLSLSDYDRWAIDQLKFDEKSLLETISALKKSKDVLDSLFSITYTNLMAFEYLLTKDNDIINLFNDEPRHALILYNIWDLIQDHDKFFNNWIEMYSHESSRKISSNVFDAFSVGQLTSKSWLIDKLIELDIDLGSIWILGGWIGSLAYLLFENNKSLKFNSIHNFDIDKHCANLADILNKDMVANGWMFKASTLNVNELLYTDFQFETIKNDNKVEILTRSCNTVINTSCDHMGNDFTWWNNIPIGTVVVLQNNDFQEINEHNNIVNSIDEFEHMYKMTTILYSGKIDCNLYNRYMIIGRK